MRSNGRCFRRIKHKISLLINSFGCAALLEREGRVAVIEAGGNVCVMPAAGRPNRKFERAIFASWDAGNRTHDEMQPLEAFKPRLNVP